MKEKAQLLAKLEQADDETLRLSCPEVGLWREQPERGSLVYPGAQIGRLEVLGRIRPLYAPAGARGLVVEVGGNAEQARREVGFGSLLLRLDPAAVLGEGAAVAERSGQADGAQGLCFRAPSSGRFYSRPAPDKAPFVTEGARIQRGDAVAMVEVMKTFNRILYGGDELPAQARVKRIVPVDGDDLAAGDVILELEISADDSG